MSAIEKIAKAIVKFFDKVKLFLYKIMPNFVKRWVGGNPDAKDDPKLKELTFRCKDLEERSKEFGNKIGMNVLKRSITVGAVTGAVGAATGDEFEAKSAGILASLGQLKGVFSDIIYFKNELSRA